MSPDTEEEELNQIKWFYCLFVAESSLLRLYRGDWVVGGITVITVVSPGCLVMEENWQALSKSSQIKILLGENGSKWILLG